jgi:hypothetical protein
MSIDFTACPKSSQTFINSIVPTVEDHSFLGCSMVYSVYYGKEDSLSLVKQMCFQYTSVFVRHSYTAVIYVHPLACRGKHWRWCCNRWPGKRRKTADICVHWGSLFPSPLSIPDDLNLRYIFSAFKFNMVEFYYTAASCCIMYSKLALALMMASWAETCSVWIIVSRICVWL